jgi:peroxiredoxin
MTSPGAAPAPPAVGDPAPDFTLRHTFGHDLNLHAALSEGPVLLAFYVFDFGFA